MPQALRGFTLPTWTHPYHYKKGRPFDFSEKKNRIQIPAVKEDLSGFVHGEDASDLEERFAIALDIRQLEFIFQFPVTTLYSLPGEEKQVDFVVDLGFRFPIEVDAEFTHRGAAQQSEDRLRDAQIDEVLSRQGFFPIQRISGADLQSIEDALGVVDRIF